MINYISRKLTCISTLLVFCFLMSTFTQAENVSAIKTFRSLAIASGVFEQKKYFKVLKHPIVSQGEFYFDQQLGFIWQTNSPIYSATLLKEDKLYLIDHLKNKQQLEAGAAIAKVLVGAIAGDIERLQREFTVSELTADKSVEQEKNTATYCWSLVPKDKGLQQVFLTINLCGEQTIDHIVLNEVSGNRTEIQLTTENIEQLPENIRAQLH